MGSKSMPVSKSAVLAIIKLSKPSFKSRAARLAYATHAFFLARGATVVAVGQQADDADPDVILTSEVEMKGWDEMQDHFAFRYLPESGRTEDALQVMMDTVGNALVIHWATVASSRPPKSLQLSLSQFTQDAAGVQEGYSDTQELVDILNNEFETVESEGSHSAAEASTDQAVGATTSAGTASRTRHLEEEGEVDDALTAARMAPQGVESTWPRTEGGAVGGDDLLPPGLRAPGSGVGPAIPHLGGGMHVGLNDPLYASCLRQGGRIDPGRVPPGARFDPINPQGLPGWNPDDFQRQGGVGRIHPDIMPRGPGRGTDFDSMFG